MMARTMVGLLAGVLWISVGYAQSDTGRQEIHEAIDEVFSDPKLEHYRDLSGRSLLDDFFEQDDEPIKGESSIPAEALALFGGVLAYAVLGVVILALALVFFLILLAVKRSNRAEVSSTRATEGEVTYLSDAAVDLPADELLARAEELAAQGECREALVYLMGGCFRQVERAGLIRPRKGLTVRDYWKALRRKTDARESFSEISGFFEEVHFGRRSAGADRFVHCVTRYRESIQGLGE